MNNTSALETFFQPHTIAVVGVSHEASAVGSTIYRNILDGGFKGEVYPVNPFLSTFQGVTSYRSALTIPKAIDMAIIVVPAAIVPSVLEEIGKKGIPVAVVISSGFSEIGSKGSVLEKQIRDISKKYSIALLGPNCLGVIHPHDKLNASFARTKPLPGSIAFLSQSGALGTALLDIITPKGIGLSHFISLGNKADINELDILEYLMHDSSTSVIGMYVEQLTDAARCIRIGKKISGMDNPKPIVVLKGGKSNEGNTAVRSHTGALAGIPEAYSALFVQSMMIEVQSTQEFINTLVSFSQNPLPIGNNCVTVTNAGGPAILATDTLVSQQVSVHPLSYTHNPIDLLGDAKASDYQKILGDLEADPSVGSILGIVTPQSVTEIEDTANAFCIHKTKSKKPLAVCWMGDGVMKVGRQLLDMGNIPGSKYPEQTATMIANLHRLTSMRSAYSQKDVQSSLPAQIKKTQFNKNDPLSLCTSLGIPVPRYVFTDDISSLPDKISLLGKTTVIKIISQQIVHKSEAGAVRLNIPKDHACETARDMIKHIKITVPGAFIDGILCMDMVDTGKGIECIVGIKKEEGLGTLIMLGMGGVFVEVMKDVTFRFAPLSAKDASDLISGLKSSAIFDGIRGKPLLDKNALIKTLLDVSAFAIEHQTVTQLDINPLLVLPQGKGVMALDCRVTLSE